MNDPILVVSDGAPGLIRAIEEVFPRSLRQRCLAHRIRNLEAKVSEERWREVKGQAVMAFAVLKDATLAQGEEGRAKVEKSVMATVNEQLGAIARPSRVHFVALLPKTRSGKLLRRSIQALAEGRDPGDLTTLDDPSALDQVKAAVLRS